MRRSVTKTALAEHDLINIWLYTQKNWGETQADTYLDELEQTLLLISEQPYLASPRVEFTPCVRIHHHAHHLIVYQVLELEIAIIRILHESMDIESQLVE